jgi:hypothetical protein
MHGVRDDGSASILDRVDHHSLIVWTWYSIRYGRGSGLTVEEVKPREVAKESTQVQESSQVQLPCGDFHQGSNRKQAHFVMCIEDQEPRPKHT